MATGVFLAPYKHFLLNMENLVAPNPRCCSDPKQLCGNCAALVLRRAGITTNANEDDPTVNAHPSGLTPTPPPAEYITPVKRVEPCRPCDDEEERTEPVKFSPAGVPLTYMPPPAER